MDREQRPVSNVDQIAGLLLEGRNAFRVREAVAFRNGRGERRVSWWAHRAELDVLREHAGGLKSSVSAVVRQWWLDGLPLLIDTSVMLGDSGGWTVYVHHLPRFLPRARGTPRGGVGRVAVTRGGVGLGDRPFGQVAPTARLGMACRIPML